jgi:type IV secretory pathway VirB4 component
MLGIPKHFKEAKNERSLSPFIPYSCVVTPNTVKTREGDYLRTWKLSGVPFETVDPVDLAIWKDNLNTLFRSIGSERISIYVHQVRRQTFDRLPGSFENQFCRELDENYYSSFGGYRMLRNELYFTLVYRPGSGVQRRLLRVARTLEDIKRAQEKALQSLGELSSQVESGLSRYKPKLLGNRTEQGIPFSEPLELLNFLVSGSWQPVRLPGAPLYESLGTSQVMVGTETIELRGVSSSRYLRLLDLKDYPTETEPGIFDGLLYAKVEYVLTQSFAFVSTATGKAALIRQRNQLSGADEGSSSQVQQMNEAIDSLTSGDFAVGEYHFSLAVFGEDLESFATTPPNSKSCCKTRASYPLLLRQRSMRPSSLNFLGIGSTEPGLPR